MYVKYQSTAASLALNKTTAIKDLIVLPTGTICYHSNHLIFSASLSSAASFNDKNAFTVSRSISATTTNFFNCSVTINGQVSLTSLSQFKRLVLPFQFGSLTVNSGSCINVYNKQKFTL